ncbi:MAG TPA: T9SS type A sorting domain-containing protein [Bacteroidia bacterium]|jgi:sugar lactone lactonase YvrE
MGSKIFLTALFFIFSSSHAQIISTIGGNGTPGYSGDNGPATSARFLYPYGLALDASGNLYIADNGNNCIRKIDVNGIITTVAGTGAQGYSGDNGPATSATFYYPYDVAVDAAGNIFICDYGNSVIRKVDVNGMITTVAGTGVAGFSGDGGLAVNAKLDRPVGVDLDANGNMYISDGYNNRVRKVDALGIITTFAGTGVMGYTGDGGPADSATFKYPYSVAFDQSGNVYISDGLNNCVRKVDVNNIITTFAGTGSGGYTGDGGPADQARLYSPQGISMDQDGNLFIVDRNNHVIRKVDASGMISTYAGTGVSGFSGDGGFANLAQLRQPYGIEVGPGGYVFIADQWNQRIRQVDTSTVLTSVGPSSSARVPRLFPNPNPGSFTVNSDQLLYLDIFNSLGEKVYSGITHAPAEETKITRVPGIYFYTLRDDAGLLHSGKFIVE